MMDEKELESFRKARRQKFLDPGSYEESKRIYKEEIADTELRIRRNTDIKKLEYLCGLDVEDKFFLFSLRYTAGEPLDKLRHDFEDVVAAYERYAKYDRQNEGEPDWPAFSFTHIDDYVRCLALVSIAILLRQDLLPRIHGLIAESAFDGQDALYEELTKKFIPDRLEIDQWYHNLPYRYLLDCIDSDTAEERIADMQSYLKSWYKYMKGCGWYDSHKNQGPEGGGYFGYWAWEAAAVAYLYDLDDTSFRDHLVYPKDLVAFARQHFPIDQEQHPPTSTPESIDSPSNPHAHQTKYQTIRMETLIELIRLCVPGNDAAVAEAIEIAQSVAAGEGWEELDIDPNDEVSIDEIWDAVCQSLVENGLMLFVDWNAYDEVVDQAQMLASRYSLDAEFEWDYLDLEEPTVELGLWEFARWLQPYGYAVCCPDSGGDSYYAFVVKLDDVPRILECAEKLEIRIDWMDPNLEPSNPLGSYTPPTLDEERLRLQAEHTLEDFQRFLVQGLSRGYDEAYRPWLEQKTRSWPEIFARLEKLGDLQSIGDCFVEDLPRKARRLVQMRDHPQVYLGTPDKDDLNVALTSFAWWFNRQSNWYGYLSDLGAAIISFEGKTFLATAPKSQNFFLLSLEMAGASIQWIERVKPRAVDPDMLPDAIQVCLDDYLDLGLDNASDAEFKSVRRQIFLSERGYAASKVRYQADMAEFAQEQTDAKHEAPESEHSSLALANIKFDQFSLRYTAGEPIDQLRQDFEEVVAAFERYAKTLRDYHQEPHWPAYSFTFIDDYVRLLALLSLAILLRRDELIPRIHSLVADSGFDGQDCVYETILGKFLPNRPDPDYWYHDYPFGMLIDTTLGDTPEESIEFMQSYLKHWYLHMTGCYWYGSHMHQSEGGGYVGYWAWEAAAVAYLYDLDDTSFRDHLAYPKDLVAFARSRQANAGQRSV